MKNIGVCIDDWVADYTKYFIGSQIEKKNRKEIIKSLEDCVLSNTTKSNLKEIDFLEVFFNWTKNTSTPYIKPSDIPLKINSLKPSRNYLNTDCKFRQNKNLQVKYCLKATSGYMNMH